jgi:thiol-disulfide isomerase/thioredoxin
MSRSKMQIRNNGKKIALMLVGIILVVAVGVSDARKDGSEVTLTGGEDERHQSVQQASLPDKTKVSILNVEQIASRPGFAPAPPGPQPGAPAPAFSLKGLDGKVYEVGGKRDKLLLLNFWASWCGPCEEEAPLLVKLYEKHKDSLDLYAVNVTAEDSRANAESFAKAFAFPFPVLLDEQGQIAAKYRIFGIPTSFLINRDGDIVDVIHLADAAQWEAKLSRWLQ